MSENLPPQSAAPELPQPSTDQVAVEVVVGSILDLFGGTSGSIEVERQEGAVVLDFSDTESDAAGHV